MKNSLTGKAERCLRHGAGLLALLCLAACAGITHAPEAPRPVVAPLVSNVYRHAPEPKTLLVLLPGIASDASDFDRHGWIAELRTQQPAVDAVVVDSHYGYFADHTLVERLHADVIERAQREGYTDIWLVGTSLGGFGALLYLREHPMAVRGVVLLSPFLGPADRAQAIREAGWEHWQAAEGDGYGQLWAWLRDLATDERQRIWLGYGRFDPFWRQHGVLAGLLPPAQVRAVAGAHEWWTGGRLWRWVLQQAPWQATAGE